MFKYSLGLTVVVFAVAGCGIEPLRMEVNPAIAYIEPLAVQGHNPRRWDRPITFGKWHTVTIDERSTRHASNELLATQNQHIVDATQSWQPYRFELASDQAGASTRGECQARRSAVTITHGSDRVTDVTTIASPGDPILHCEFSTDVERSSGGMLSLRTVASHTGELEEGEAFFNRARWTIRSVNHFQGERNHFPTNRYGYELLSDQQVIGAVETNGRGRVWIDPSLTEADQDGLAAVITALLLYQPEKLDRDND